jgi:hypothetical protein
LKGGRECIFPEKPPSSKSSGRSKAAAAESGSSSNEDEQSKGLETILDNENESKSEKPARGPSVSSVKGKSSPIPQKSSFQSLNTRKPGRLLSETPSSGKEKSHSPSTETTDASSVISISQPLSSHGQLSSPSANEATASAAGTSWSHLSKDVRFYLTFHQERITHHHYFLKHDPKRFLHGELVDLALSYDPLLYAVVGFAAFHHALRQADGKVATFLNYYTRSVSKLRRSLQTGQQHHESVLLTILQLATFEVRHSLLIYFSTDRMQEYLGDWPNLVGHQRAAHHLLMELYTPTSIMKSYMRRQIFTWYSRFDVVASLLGGNETILGREWYVASENFHRQQADNSPDDLETQLASLVAICRTIGVDMATLFAKLPRGLITMEQFMAQNQELEESIQNVRVRLEELSKLEYAIFSFPDKEELGLNDIVNPYQPGGLYSRPYFMLNFSWIDWNAVSLMHRYQTALTLKQLIPPELEQLALEQCRILEAIEKWSDSPSGSLLAVHASLGLASIFLPKDYRHTMWLRRKLARMEQMG